MRSGMGQALLGPGWNYIIVMWEIRAHLPALGRAEGEAPSRAKLATVRPPGAGGRGRRARPGLELGQRDRGSGRVPGAGGHALRGSRGTPSPDEEERREEEPGKARGGVGGEDDSRFHSLQLR